MAQPATVTASEGGILDRFPWYVQLLVLLAVILLVAFLVDYFMFMKWRTEAAKMDQEAQELRRQNQEADIVRANIAEYQKRLYDLNSQLDVLKVRLPEEREVTNIFENAQSMIKTSGLKLSKFNISAKDAEIPQKYYTEVSSTVEVAGGYRSVQDLFQKLSAYDRIVNVTDIRLTQAAEKDQASGATTLAAFKLTAFYISAQNREALEQGPEAEAETKGKGKGKGKGKAPAKPAAKK
jgi:Tfp pilus assembly protein PilO